VKPSSQPGKKIIYLLVCDLLAVDLLYKEVSFTHVILAHMNLAVCNPDVDVLHRAHQIVDKTLAVSTYDVDQRIG